MDKGGDSFNEIESKVEKRLKKQKEKIDKFSKKLDKRIEEFEHKLEEKLEKGTKRPLITSEKPEAAVQEEIPSPEIAPSVSPEQVTKYEKEYIPFREVAPKKIEVKFEHLKKLNFSLIYNEFSLIPQLEIVNNSDEDLEDVLIRVWVSPDYGEAWESLIPSIPSGESHFEEGINVPLIKKRLQEVKEAEKAFLKIVITAKKNIIYSKTYPIEVLPYNEWFYHPQIAEIIASFAMPNNNAIAVVINKAKNHLKELSGESSFDGYQSRNPEKIEDMVKSIYLALEEELDISYINPPASFEPTGQKISFPRDVLKNQRGTCLDLALLYCGCLERIGLNPVMILLQGHALMGCWIYPLTFDTANLRDWGIVNKAIADNKLLILNSTTFTQDRPFKECRKEAKKLISKEAIFECTVDITKARQQAVKPLPPIT